MNTFNNSFQSRLTRIALGMVAAGVIGLSAPALAQHHGERGMERMIERLELTTEQAEAIANLRQAHRDQMQSVQWRTEVGERNREARREARESRQALREEMSEILTEEQQAELEAMRAERPKRGHGKGRRQHCLDG